MTVLGAHRNIADGLNSHNNKNALLIVPLK